MSKNQPSSNGASSPGSENPFELAASMSPARTTSMIMSVSNFTIKNYLKLLSLLRLEDFDAPRRIISWNLEQAWHLRKKRWERQERIASDIVSLPRSTEWTQALRKAITYDFQERAKDKICYSGLDYIRARVLVKESGRRHATSSSHGNNVNQGGGENSGQNGSGKEGQGKDEGNTVYIAHHTRDGDWKEIGDSTLDYDEAVVLSDRMQGVWTSTVFTEEERSGKGRERLRDRRRRLMGQDALNYDYIVDADTNNPDVNTNGLISNNSNSSQPGFTSKSSSGSSRIQPSGAAGQSPTGDLSTSPPSVHGTNNHQGNNTSLSPPSSTLSLPQSIPFTREGIYNYRPKVWLYFHGGGYVMGSPKWLTYREMAASMVSLTRNVMVDTWKRMTTSTTDTLTSSSSSPSPIPTPPTPPESRPRGVAMLAIDYRLAPEHPFPAAIEDGVAAYHYLIRDLGVPPSDIVIAGDSAGGNLATAVTIALQRLGDEIDISRPVSRALSNAAGITPTEYPSVNHPNPQLARYGLQKQYTVPSSASPSSTHQLTSPPSNGISSSPFTPSPSLDVKEEYIRPPRPAGLILYSPWLDLAASTQSITTNAVVDPIIPAAAAPVAGRAYVGVCRTRLGLQHSLLHIVDPATGTKSAEGLPHHPTSGAPLMPRSLAHLIDTPFSSASAPFSNDQINTFADLAGATTDAFVALLKSTLDPTTETSNDSTPSSSSSSSSPSPSPSPATSHWGSYVTNAIHIAAHIAGVASHPEPTSSPSHRKTSNQTLPPLSSSSSATTASPSSLSPINNTSSHTAQPISTTLSTAAGDHVTLTAADVHRAESDLARILRYPIVSPFYASPRQLRWLPPTLVVCGAREILLDEGVNFFNNLSKATLHGELHRKWREGEINGNNKSNVPRLQISASDKECEKARELGIIKEGCDDDKHQGIGVATPKLQSSNDDSNSEHVPSLNVSLSLMERLGELPGGLGVRMSRMLKLSDYDYDESTQGDDEVVRCVRADLEAQGKPQSERGEVRDRQLQRMTKEAEVKRVRGRDEGGDTEPQKTRGKEGHGSLSASHMLGLRSGSSEPVAISRDGRWIRLANDAVEPSWSMAVDVDHGETAGDNEKGGIGEYNDGELDADSIEEEIHWLVKKHLISDEDELRKEFFRKVRPWLPAQSALSSSLSLSSTSHPSSKHKDKDEATTVTETPAIKPVSQSDDMVAAGMTPAPSLSPSKSSSCSTSSSDPSTSPSTVRSAPNVSSPSAAPATSLPSKGGDKTISQIVSVATNDAALSKSNLPISSPSPHPSSPSSPINSPSSLYPQSWGEYLWSWTPYIPYIHPQPSSHGDEVTYIVTVKPGGSHSYHAGTDHHSDDTSSVHENDHDVTEDDVEDHHEMYHDEIEGGEIYTELDDIASLVTAIMDVATGKSSQQDESEVIERIELPVKKSQAGKGMKEHEMPLGERGLKAPTVENIPTVREGMEGSQHAVENDYENNETENNINNASLWSRWWWSTGSGTAKVFLQKKKNKKHTVEPVVRVSMTFEDYATAQGKLLSRWRSRREKQQTVEKQTQQPRDEEKGGVRKESNSNEVKISDAMKSEGLKDKPTSESGAGILEPACRHTLEVWPGLFHAFPIVVTIPEARRAIRDSAHHVVDTCGWGKDNEKE